MAVIKRRADSASQLTLPGSIVNFLCLILVLLSQRAQAPTATQQNVPDVHEEPGGFLQAHNHITQWGRAL